MSQPLTAPFSIVRRNVRVITPPPQSEDVVVTMRRDLQSALDRIASLKARRTRLSAEIAGVDRETIEVVNAIRQLQTESRQLMQSPTRDAIELVNKISNAVAATFRI